jgi:uncharacterized membrane protein YeiH
MPPRPPAAARILSTPRRSISPAWTHERHKELKTLSDFPNLATHAPLWLSLLTVGVNAVVGALHGYQDDSRHWDLVGVAIFALLMGLGGGFIRDSLLGTLPAQSLRSPWYLATVLTCAAAVLLVGQWLVRLHALLIGLNAVALGLFAITGAAAALGQGLPDVCAVLIGAITAVGGGVLVSVMQGRVPTILVASTPNALLAVLGALTYVLLAPHSAGTAAIVGLLSVIAAQLVVARWNITTHPAGASNPQ